MSFPKPDSPGFPLLACLRSSVYIFDWFRCWRLSICISSTILLALTMAKHAAVRVGLHAFWVGITPQPPMNKFSSRQTFECLSTTECPSSSFPARVVPQMCNAAPGARYLGSPPGRKSPRSKARSTMLQSKRIQSVFLFKTGNENQEDTHSFIMACARSASSFPIR